MFHYLVILIFGLDLYRRQIKTAERITYTNTSILSTDRLIPIPHRYTMMAVLSEQPQKSNRLVTSVWSRLAI